MKHADAMLPLALMFACSSVNAGAQSARGQLAPMVARLHANSTDLVLRERIITLVAGLKPAPAIPPEAERFEGRAQAAFKGAKNELELLDAVHEYLNAVDAAPWVPGYYFDLCAILEKANRRAAAVRACKLYLLAAPSAPDLSDVRKRIAGIEYAMERVRTQVASRRPCTTMAAEFEEGSKIGSIDGRRISTKLISFLKDGQWRNQVMVTDITTLPDGLLLRRWDLGPSSEWTELGTLSIRVILTADDGVSVEGRSSATPEIVTSVAELLQRRNDQIKGCTLTEVSSITRGSKWYVQLGQGGPLSPKFGGRINGGLMFEADCSGALLGEKPGWYPAILIPHPDTPGVTADESSPAAQGFEQSDGTYCADGVQVGDGLDWLYT